MRQRKKAADDDCFAPSERWERSGDAVIDKANGFSPVDFVTALKNQSAAAWVAVKTIIVNPVLNEKNIKTIIREKRFEEDEVFEGAGR